MDPLEGSRRLAEEHAMLDVLSEDVRTRIAKADWFDCDVIWRRFGELVEDHFRFEERELWPEFSTSAPNVQDELIALAAEREDIRAALDRIGIEIELKHVDRPAIEQLLGRLHAHVLHEHELFHTRPSARPE